MGVICRVEGGPGEGRLLSQVSRNRSRGFWGALGASGGPQGGLGGPQGGLRGASGGGLGGRGFKRVGKGKRAVMLTTETFFQKDYFKFMYLIKKIKIKNIFCRKCLPFFYFV